MSKRICAIVCSVCSVSEYCLLSGSVAVSVKYCAMCQLFAVQRICAMFLVVFAVSADIVAMCL